MFPKTAHRTPHTARQHTAPAPAPAPARRTRTRTPHTARRTPHAATPHLIIYPDFFLKKYLFLTYVLFKT